MFNSIRNENTVCQVVYHFTLPPAMYENLLFLASTKTRLLSVFKISAVLVVAPHYDLNLHFFCWPLFTWLVIIFHFIFMPPSIGLSLTYLDKSLLAYASYIFSSNVARFYPIFSSRNVIVLSFVVTSMIHFKFIPLYGRNKGWSCFFFCFSLWISSSYSHIC